MTIGASIERGSATIGRDSVVERGSATIGSDRAITDKSEVAQRAIEEGNFPIITIVYLQTQARSKRPSIQ